MGAHGSDAAEVMTSLRRLVRMIRLADHDAKAGHDLSAAQLFVVHSLASAPASSLAELARRTLTDQSSVSTVVAKLVAKKLVQRSTNALDRRRAELHVTPAGQRLVDNAPQLLQTRIIEAVAAMPDKPRKELVRSLESLVDAVGADAVEPRMFSDEP
ncbi:MAG: MarR family winged helix-turn-helix transcriptional regulator [Kofleriaceae bacterium]